MHFVRVNSSAVTHAIFQRVTPMIRERLVTPIVIALDRYFLNAGDSFGQHI